MSLEHYLPVFQEEALCRNYTPDWWFPDYDGTQDEIAEARTQERIAKSVCLECPAFQECQAYSMQFTGLHGIWAGMNQRERHRKQKRLGNDTQRWLDTWPLMLYNKGSEEIED